MDNTEEKKYSFPFTQDDYSEKRIILPEVKSAMKELDELGIKYQFKYIEGARPSDCEIIINEEDMNLVRLVNCKFLSYFVL